MIRKINPAPGILLVVIAVSLIQFLFSGCGGNRAVIGKDYQATTVFLVRHAERSSVPAEDPALSDEGTARARLLMHVLEKAGITAIYTSQYLRTAQTAEPLAKTLGIKPLSIEITRDETQPNNVARKSLAKIAEAVKIHRGEKILIVGHSNTIPAVIRALNGDVVPNIGDNDYNDLFIVTIYGGESAKVVRLRYGNRAE